MQVISGETAKKGMNPANVTCSMVGVFPRARFAIAWQLSWSRNPEAAPPAKSAAEDHGMPPALASLGSSARVLPGALVTRSAAIARSANRPVPECLLWVTAEPGSARGPVADLVGSSLSRARGAFVPW